MGRLGYVIVKVQVFIILIFKPKGSIANDLYLPKKQRGLYILFLEFSKTLVGCSSFRLMLRIKIMQVRRMFRNLAFFGICFCKSRKSPACPNKKKLHYSTLLFMYNLYCKRCIIFFLLAQYFTKNVKYIRSGALSNNIYCKYKATKPKL